MNRPWHPKRPIAAIAVAFGLALAASPALADSSTSSNWSGYAVHHSGVSFRKVTARWREPAAVCRPGFPSFSAIWVGLGGFSLNSQALEQIGTEVDCNRAGSVVPTAWYELVPAASKTIKLRPRAGDTMQASVSANGHRVTLSLSDRTRHTSFTKTFSVSHLDVSSAEWIVEAPSECTGSLDCQTLPLADFGSVKFTNAAAVTSSGRTGSISSRRWSTTRITLALDGQRFVSTGAPAVATPSLLGASGSAFSVSFGHDDPVAVQPAFSQRRESVAGGAVAAGAARRPTGALRRP